MLLRVVASIGVACFCLCGLATAALAAGTPTPPLIGDRCLVGRWVETRQSAPGNWTVGNQVVPVAGLAGLVITFTADGTETDDLSGAQPLVGDYQGHQVKFVERGVVRFQVYGDGSLLSQAAAGGSASVKFYYDGVYQPTGFIKYTAGTYNYRCGSATLHREGPAGYPGYGPIVDDLVRSSPSSAGGSLVSPFSGSLATPASVLAAPVTLLISAAIALAAVLLITFPSHLFNRTYEENHEIIRYWWERRFPWILHLRLRALAGSRRGLRDGLGYIAVVLCGGVLAALLDPRFGLSLRTLALFTGAVFALLAGSFVGFAAAAGYRVARHRAGSWHLHALPSGLVVGAACVLVSRVTDFQPGYLYGLIGGVVFARQLTRREEGHTVAVTSLVMLAVAVAAWLAWVPVSAQSAAHPTSFAWAVASNFLAAVFVSGMVGLLIGLVPLRFLPGEKLASWHRGVWGAVFGLAALSVIEVMLRPQSAGGHVAAAPFLTTAGLFIAFGLASVAFWGYFKVRRDSTSRAKASPAGSTDN
ncbi:MAG TPA: FGLLP motif-containing membrane protein [Candidatus Dormibacteraeota bacterium]|nr:FGLLP motif-containing membrane protein [Candidatus Dormibacteraeota bacterium]